MKYLLVGILGSIVFVGCTYRPTEKRLGNFNESTRVLNSFYRLGDTLEIKRIIAGDNSLMLQSGQIFSDKFALTHQSINDVRVVHAQHGIDSIRKELIKAGFVNRLMDARDVMFVQLVPDSVMNNFDRMGFLNLRQEIEEKIDERFRSAHLGEWFSGDMGAGGNMLFFVDDWDNAMEQVFEILKDETLLNHVLIARRISISENEWCYEVVYPAEFQGLFNSI